MTTDLHETGACTIVTGDALETLRLLPDCSIQCCVTSPPYWGLRDYGTAKWEGGDPACDHLGKPMPTRAGFNERYFERESAEDNKQDALREPQGKQCSKCGATRIDSQLGLESTPEEYVAKMVAVFREVKRVLRDDGTLWLNLGDSYAANRTYQVHNTKGAAAHTYAPGSRVPDGLKPKDLVGIPWRVAFALQADGWYLRQDIIWAKPNPMPEPVRDRCTKSHEYIFLMSKSEKYYFDEEDIKEPSKYPDDDRKSRSAITDKRMPTEMVAGVRPGSQSYPVRNKRSVWTVTTKPFSGAKMLADYVGADGKPYKVSLDCSLHGHLAPTPTTSHSHLEGRAGSVARMPENNTLMGGSSAHPSGHTGNHSADKFSFGSVYCKCAIVSIDHFATFPTDLIEPCILAGTSEKGRCPHCGAPWKRVVEKRAPNLEHQRACGGDANGEYDGGSTKDYAAAGAQDVSATKARILARMVAKITTGWVPTCKCPAHEPVPCVVLDPFAGAGTTGLVAQRHSRKALLIELNPEYVGLMETRLKKETK